MALPQMETSAAAARQKPRGAEVRPCTIILVDDDQDDRTLSIGALKRSPNVRDVLTLPDGEDFITYLKDHGFYDRSVLCLNPILILLDLNMPRLNGFDVLKEVKSDPFLKEVPIVVLTGVRTDQKILEAFRLGADGYLIKPLDAAKLESFMIKSWSWPPRDMWS